ncbi:hypothetical protein Poly24_38000 [Rosistilla carotiformis]|uniref:Uncharacterized protein n=1 Tax=Rosistilla carotiformis TaxID=2528017 RepID=A0A518JX18_9BACT|nr:hypothetical protein [Rosistilla carotiformis]QDV70081.1 hypothetical protein Poly24_38000 [Rosistilla carotiformis]
MKTVNSLRIEIGVVVAGELDTVDREALGKAIEWLSDELTKTHSTGGLQFCFTQLQRPEMLVGFLAEPSILLRQAQEERDRKHWDFVFVVTAAELIGKYTSSSCFAALSRPFDAAVFSTSLIDPKASGEPSGRDQRVERIAGRLGRLMLHAIGHLSGLGQMGDAENFMYRPTSASEVDRMSELEEWQQERQQASLIEMADPRLEEDAPANIRRWWFAPQAAWINRREIAEAVWAARPWQFPRRLSGLAIASVSTLLVLMMTAEAWDLALAQSIPAQILLAVLVLIAATVFVAMRQQLLIRRSSTRSEQNVVTTVSALLIVSVGLATMWVMLLVFALLISSLLFSAPLIASWAASGNLAAGQVDFGCRFAMSSFGSSLGLLIGALGASFESQNYFQHVIFVDEEL